MNLFRHRILVLILLLLLVASAGTLWYRDWNHGRVVASLEHGSLRQYYTFRIREIPMQPPLSNDGYAYRCEVWWRDILIKASTHSWDSFTARKTSITVTDGTKAVFSIDEHKISCDTFEVWSDSRWETLQ